VADGHRRGAPSSDHWTELVAGVATSVHVTDLNEETLALARARAYRRGNATFAVQDAYTPASAPPAWEVT
jgi:hypothetical protein